MKLKVIKVNEKTVLCAVNNGLGMSTEVVYLPKQAHKLNDDIDATGYEVCNWKEAKLKTGDVAMLKTIKPIGA